jgi:hypothetical protein
VQCYATSELLVTVLYLALQSLPFLSHISCMKFYSLITRSKFMFAHDSPGGGQVGLLLKDARSTHAPHGWGQTTYMEQHTLDL